MSVLQLQARTRLLAAELKPSHKGRFHRWLGKSEDEKLTKADIAKGLASKDPKVRKMAQFAENFRK